MAERSSSGSPSNNTGSAPVRMPRLPGFNPGGLSGRATDRSAVVIDRSPSSRIRAVRKLGGAFDHVADAQHGFFVEGAADHLQAERQPVGAEPGRDRDRRQSGEID